MQWTPDDIAASIGNDPAIKPEDILYKYLKEDAQVRYEALKEYFAGFGLSLTEQEMVRLMAIQEDILFTEASDGRGRFWQASIAPGQQAGPREGYLDHRITDQFDDAMGQDFDDEEEDFTGRDLAGINATPQAGEMGSLNGEGAPSDLGGFDTQEGMPDATGAATDETEVPPAAIPQAMPDMVAQAMAAQMGMPDPATQASPDTAPVNTARHATFADGLRRELRVLGQRRRFLVDRRSQLRAAVLVTATSLVLLVLLNLTLNAARSQSTSAILAHTPALEELLLEHDRLETGLTVAAIKKHLYIRRKAGSPESPKQ